MHPAVIIAAIVVLAAALAKAKPADARPGGQGGGGGGGRERTMPRLPGTLKQRFGPIVGVLTGPMPPGAMLEIIRHESGGKPGVVVADQVTGASELGATQLVVEHDAEGNPNPSSSAGAIGADVDPLDPWGAVYGAQVVYRRAKDRAAEEIRSRGMELPADDEVETWISLMQAQHSIGMGALRRLLDLGKAKGDTHPLDVYERFARREMPPAIGRMSAELVRRRLRNMLDLPAVARRNIPLPPRILSLPPRASSIPRFDAAKAKRYILAERARVRRRPRPSRRADGSPPGV